jgi:hypothetical protein
LPETVDEQHVECGIVLTQPSQETQVNTDTEEPPFVGSNKTILNVKPVCENVDVDDGVADMGLISCVDPEPIVMGFAQDVEPSFVDPEYDAVSGDERANHSVDDRSILELSNRDNALLLKRWRNMLVIYHSYWCSTVHRGVPTSTSTRRASRRLTPYSETRMPCPYIK